MIPDRNDIIRLERAAYCLWREKRDAKQLTYDTPWDQLDWRTRNMFRREVQAGRMREAA